MWEWIVIPMLTMAVGFLIGIMVGDRASTNMQIDDLRMELNKLRRQLEVMRRQSSECSETGGLVK